MGTARELSAVFGIGQVRLPLDENKLLGNVNLAPQ